MANMIDRAIELRDDAVRALAQTSEWTVAKAADDIVEALGGKRSLPVLGGVRVRSLAVAVAPVAPRVSGKLSQGDAAEQVISEAGKPLPVAHLVTALEERGVVVGGEKREINLSSQLSRDDRFTSVRVQGQAMWTLKRLLDALTDTTSFIGEDDDL